MNLRLLLPRAVAALAGGLLVLGAAAACGDDDQPSANAAASSAAGTAQPSKVTLTVYSGQHEGLTQSLADAFQKETGIKIELRSGKDADLANQIIEEGSRTRADVFMTEEPGPIAQVDKAGLLSPVPAASLARVDKKYVPSTGNWIPYAARARAIYYNPSLIAENQLPASIMDLVKPEWKGKFAYAPSGAFTGTVTYLINTIGKDATLTWLKGIKENGVNEGSNGKVRDTVEAGQHAFGLSNHYYWWILANQKGGPDKIASKIHYFTKPDAGSLVFASGAGVLKASGHQAEAQRFIDWLASPDGGQALIASSSNAQYPVAIGVTSKVGLQPLQDLASPTFDQGSLSDSSAAKDLIIQAGIS